MTQFVVAVVTAMVTVGVVLPAPALLDTTPFASTPEIVKLYVLLGVTPFGVEVLFVVLPHAGISRSEPLSTKRPSSHHALRVCFPPAAAPTPTRASIGKGSQNAHICAWRLGRANSDPVVVTTGPKLVIVSDEVATCPSGLTGTGFGSNLQIGGTVTRGVMELHESVLPCVGGVVTGVE